ncbi:MAG: hypothetical protein JNL98_17105 [Bryobacterales bacterium]|nr:hypothetical protein [Bryobacterales bacterium]
MASGNPFVGPNPLTSKQPLFGRDREVRELSYLLTSDRIVLLHSPSGAGKSSLLSAKGGLISRMQRSFDVCGPLRVNEAPTRDVKNRFVWSVAHGMAPAIADGSAAPSLLECAKDRDKEQDNLLLIFDQFEEVLTVEPGKVDQKRAFFDQVGELLTQRWIWALFVIREDYLAQLDPYARRVPTHLNNRYRLDLLQKDRAKEAIEKTALSANPKRTFQAGALQELTAGLSSVNVAQPDGTFSTEPGEYIEPLQLQIVCFDLWERLAESEVEITANAVQAHGDVTQALRNFYDRTVEAVGKTGRAQFEIRNWVDEKLISNGRRDQVQFVEAAESSEGLGNRFIREMLRRVLLRREPRGTAVFVELAHDRLLNPVRDSNGAWFESRLSEYEKRARLWERTKASGLVYVDDELKAAKEWRRRTPEPLVDMDAFLAACDERQNIIDRERTLARRARVWLQRAIALALGAVVAIGFAIYYSYRAKDLEAAVIKRSNDLVSAEAETRKEKEANAKTRVQLDQAMDIAEKARKNAVTLFVKAQAETSRANTANSVATARQLLAISAGFGEADPQRALFAVASSRERVSAEGTRAMADILALLPKFVNDFVTGDFMADEAPPLAFSPDGKMMAGVHTQGDLFWGGADGSGMMTNKYRHPRNIWRVALSSSQRIAFWDGGSVSVYDIGVGRVTHRFASTSVFAISADGKCLALGEGGFSVVRLDPPPGVQKRIENAGPLVSVTFTPDSKELLSSHSSPYSWCSTSLLPSNLFELKANCHDALGKEMRSLAALDSSVFAWTTATGEVENMSPLPLAPLNRTSLGGYQAISIQWLNGQWRAMFADTRTRAMRVYDSAASKFLASIPGEAVTMHPVLPRAVSREGRFLKIYDFSPRYEWKRVAIPGSVMPAMSGNGKRLVFVQEDRARVVDAVSGQLVREVRLSVKTDRVHLSNNGRFVLAMNHYRDQGALIANHVSKGEIFDLQNGASRSITFDRRETEEGLDSGPWAVSDDGKFAIGLMTSDRVVVVDLAAGRVRQMEQQITPGTVTPVLALTADGKTFAYRSSTEQGFPTLVLRSLPVGKNSRSAVIPLLGLREDVASLAFRGDGKRLAMLDEDGNVSIYDTATLEETLRQKVAGPVASVAFHESGDLLVLYRLRDQWGIERVLKDDPQTLMKEICGRLQFTLSEQDWKKQAPALPYRNPCPALPEPRDPTLF